MHGFWKRHECRAGSFALVVEEVVSGKRSDRAFIGLILAGILMLAGFNLPLPVRAETTMPEHQVKALFLFNFAKYVEWPEKVFADGSDPIQLAVLGDPDLEESLKKVVEDKTINGHRIIVIKSKEEKDLKKCHIVFFGEGEKRRVPDILARFKATPVLTVGESDRFLEQGGIINFMKKDGKVRLEIDLNHASAAKLQLSSKLLNVADVVKGKP